MNPNSFICDSVTLHDPILQSAKPCFAGELKPLAFGIKKLTILSTVVDDKVSVDDLTEKIEALEDIVQSVDIAAFNKV